MRGDRPVRLRLAGREWDRSSPRDRWPVLAKDDHRARNTRVARPWCGRDRARAQAAWRGQHRADQKVVKWLQPPAGSPQPNWLAVDRSEVTPCRPTHDDGFGEMLDLYA